MKDIERYGFREHFGASINTRPEFLKLSNGEYVKYLDCREFEKRIAHLEIELEKHKIAIEYHNLVCEQQNSPEWRIDVDKLKG